MNPPSEDNTATFEHPEDSGIPWASIATGAGFDPAAFRSGA